MGNCAVLDFGDNVGVYLHWNGGKGSVLAFLEAADELGICPPASDPTYSAARFVQMIGNWFGGTTSIGVGPLDTLEVDNCDNGLYVLDGWAIARQEYVDGSQCAELDEAIYQEILRINRPIFGRKIDQSLHIELRPLTL